MINTFKHKGIEQFYETGIKAGIQPHHASKLSRQLLRLDIAKSHEDMNVPSWKLHGLTGALVGHYSITVNGNWRVTFMFKD